MPMSGDSVWRDINTLFEIEIEIYRLMQKSESKKGESKDTTTEKITDGVLLMSNDKEVIIAVRKETASQGLSDAAVALGTEKGDYIYYNGAATAIPLFELLKTNESVRDYIVSEESLRATLSANYPEYVKTHNMSAPTEAQIEDADAPPYLFLQKQFDNAADKTRNEVNAFQETQTREAVTENDLYDDVLELGR